MSDVAKSIQILLTTDDEAELSQALLKVVPGIRFPDNSVWDTQPLTVPSIQFCTTNFCYLHDSALEQLPRITRPDGRVQGAQSGGVVQVVRSLRQGDLLRSGTIGTGYDSANENMAQLVSATWSALQQIGTIGVRRLDGKIDRHYLLGHDADRLARAGAIRLRDRSVEVYFEPL